MTPRDQPMRSAELAGRLGHSADWLYRNLDRLVAEEKMPAPLTRRGHHTWDRASIEAWLGRHHPHAPPEPANDAAPAPEPFSDRAWQKHLAEVYSS